MYSILACFSHFLCRHKIFDPLPNSPNYESDVIYGRPLRYHLVKPLMVKHNLFSEQYVLRSSHESDLMSTFQIVIQVDELRDGLLLVRTSDHRQGACSVEYLTEV